MAIAAGTHLGPYEIQSALGAGGMGEVYRARDTRLGREVAIKVLSERFRSNANLRERFEREARAISALNHPHICTLHDVGRQDGTEFLVMELLEGETLDRRLEKGALPPAQALEYGIQICQALTKAHRAGIAHRDLKPANIMLTKAGAKLLDFGLAKPVQTIAAMASTSAETLSKPLTSEGTLVGTYPYMAPEQVQGKEADARTDIFAFGAVLYEMLTGKRAFPGKSQISVLSAILEKDPEPISAVQPLTPPALDRALRRALAKEPDERWQSAADLAAELKWIGERGQQPLAAGAAKQHAWAAWAVAAVLALIGLALAVRSYVSQAKPVVPLRVSVLPPTGVFPDTTGRNGPPAISPDGSAIAFVGCRDASAAMSVGSNSLCSIWLRSLSTGEAHQVLDTSGGYAPFWSPDGNDLAFFADGKLKRVPAGGGPVQVICDAEDARGGSWGKSGVIIFAATRGSPIFRVPAEGGTPTAVTHTALVSNLSQAGSHRWPQFLPDGQHFVYLAAPNGSCTSDELHFASLDGLQDIALMAGCSTPDFANGRLVFWRDGNLVAQPFDPQRGVLSGTAKPIAEHVALDSLFAFAEFSVSANGSVVYVAGEGPTGAQLIWYDRAGQSVGAIGENGQYESVAISPDGTRVATDNPQVGGSNFHGIRVLDVRRGSTLVTLETGSGGWPAWSADGRRIYYASETNGSFDIFVRPADGSGQAEPVVTFGPGQFGAVFLATSPDGKYLAYDNSDPITKLDISFVPLQGSDRKPRLFLHSPANESAPAFSPDGKWLAYESDQSGRNEIYVTPFPEGGAEYQVSSDGGERPVWSRDGKQIFYRENFRLMAVKVNAGGGKITLGAPTPLFDVSVRNFAGRWYDVSRDGRFLMVGSAANAEQNFELLVNWPALVNK